MPTTLITKTTEAMIQFYSGDIHRSNHFLCVHGLAKTIGELEALPPDVQEILEVAALTHDIGKKKSSRIGNAVQNFKLKVFKTRSGLHFLNMMYHA